MLFARQVINITGESLLLVVCLAAPQSLSAEAVVYLAFARSFSGGWSFTVFASLLVPTIPDDSSLSSFRLNLHIFADQVSNV